jgi:arylsulfatase A-like enzyme
MRGEDHPVVNEIESEHGIENGSVDRLIFKARAAPGETPGHGTSGSGGWSRGFQGFTFLQPMGAAPIRFAARCAVFTVAAVVAFLAACVPRPAGDGRGVLVIVIDALRADHISYAGYDRLTTPALDQLSQDGIHFRQAFSTAPRLLPSHISILTGCDPGIAERPPLPDGSSLAVAFNWTIPSAVPHLARQFLIAGYDTVAFMDHPWMETHYGFAEGFEDYHDHRSGDDERPMAVGVEGVAAGFLQWVRNRPEDANWFAYLHLNDLERSWKQVDPERDTMFEPREEWSSVPPLSLGNKVFFAVPRTRWTGGLHSLGEYEARYDGALFQLDRKLGRLFARLKKSGRWEKTTVIVTGSYGLGFGESGFILDNGSLSDVDLHVPLIVRPAADIPCERGARRHNLVSLIDLAPTALDLAGLPRPAGMHGVSQSLAMVQAWAAGDGPREFAHASSAYHDGWVIMDNRYCFERSWPGSKGPGMLSGSWFGDERSHRDEAREVLHDRRKSETPGHLGPSAEGPKLRANLRAEAESWRELVVRARDVMQETPWEKPAVSTEDLEQLRTRGMIP